MQEYLTMHTQTENVSDGPPGSARSCSRSAPPVVRAPSIPRCGRRRPGAPAPGGPGSRRYGRAGLRSGADLHGEVLLQCWLPRRERNGGELRHGVGRLGRRAWSGSIRRGRGESIAVRRRRTLPRCGRAARDGAVPRQGEAGHDAGLRRVDAADRAEADRGRLRLRPELGERARDGRPRRPPDRRSRRERRR